MTELHLCWSAELSGVVPVAMEPQVSYPLACHAGALQAAVGLIHPVIPKRPDCYCLTRLQQRLMQVQSLLLQTCLPVGEDSGVQQRLAAPLCQCQKHKSRRQGCLTWLPD